MKEFFAILLGGVLLNNYALQSFLGISTVLGSSKDTRKAAVMGCAVTVVMAIAAAIAWPVDAFILSAYGLEYLQTLVFVAIVLAAAGITGAVAKAVVKKPLGIWFPLIALNSAVLGVAVNNTAAESFLAAVAAALAAGLGFLLAMVVFCGVRSRIEEQYVPKSFRGLPVQLMAAVILVLALHAF